LNKLLGRPATPDVGTLSVVMKGLRTKTEEKLGHSIHAAVAASPNLRGLPKIDIDDALEYAGLTSLESESLGFWGPWRETAAAFAGSGMGLCTNYTDVSRCREEEMSFPTEDVIAISYSRQTLEVTRSEISVAQRPWERVTYIDWDGGLDALTQYPNTAMYWKRVRNVLREVARVFPSPFTTLLLLGDSALNEVFLRVVRDALEEFQGAEFVDIRLATGSEPLYIAAKGAAELAKRFQEAPKDCEEPWFCRWNRKAAGRIEEL